jgi:hypothetical protein
MYTIKLSLIKLQLTIINNIKKTENQNFYIIILN